MLGQEEKNGELVLLSKNVMQNQINEVSWNILNQGITDINSSSVKISLQLNNSTNVMNCSVHIVGLGISMRCCCKRRILVL